MTGGGPGSVPVAITAVAVVVPAHDEEELLGGCLSSVDRSRAELRARHPAVETRVVVVLDRCTDHSAEVAGAFDVDRVVTGHGRVGAARRSGVERATRLLAAHDPGRIWVANTDADSRVPRDWLASQVAQAGRGSLLTVGPVVPDPEDVTPELGAEFDRRHAGHAEADRVHGANLGVRLDAYLAVGGYACVGLHEDALLIGALRAAGARPGVAPVVVTSGRTTGRAPGGFAAYLRRVGGEIGAEIGVEVEERVTG